MDNRYSTFDLAFRESEGRLAIWYRTFGGNDFLVNPCTLFDSILGDSDERYFLVTDKAQLWNGDRRIMVKQTFDGKCFSWAISNFFTSNEVTLKFSYEEYWNKVKTAIVQLYEAMSSDKETYYSGEISFEQISRIYSQLKLTEMMLMPKLKRTEEIDVEQFEFICPATEQDGSTWSIDIPYTIRIGNKEYRKWISDWSNSLNKIRHNLEDFVFNGKCRFILDFDMEETSIELSVYNTLESTEHVAGGTAYHYKDFLRVVVRPGGAFDGTALIGICDKRQVVRQFYEGLLNVARVGYHYESGKYDNDWDCSPKTFYNSIKSRIIEDYLNEYKYDEDELQVRQCVVRRIVTIRPDYGNILFENENGKRAGAESLVVEDVPNMHVDRALVSEFSAWQAEFEANDINCKNGTLDTNEWERRGLELARRLRQQLPDDIDLWYAFPIEDEANRRKPPMLVYKDYSAIKDEAKRKNDLVMKKTAMWLQAAKKDI